MGAKGLVLDTTPSADILGKLNTKGRKNTMVHIDRRTLLFVAIADAAFWFTLGAWVF